MSPLERKVFYCWKEIKARCMNPKHVNYHNYGGRGISIHPEWSADFGAFARYVGIPEEKKLDLDRRDNNGNYEPGNVRWITHQKNSLNTRRNRHIPINGVTKTMSEWCDEYGIPRPTMWMRLKLGWEGADLIKPPGAGWAQRRLMIEHEGATKSAREWAASIPMSFPGFMMRYNAGLRGAELMMPSAKKKYRDTQILLATPPCGAQRSVQ